MKIDAPPFQKICPRCGSDAWNRYGHTRNGKQRYLCLVCNRQFTEGGTEKYGNRPLCPECRSGMHVYKIEPETVRFRCSHYPRCRGYVTLKEEKVSQ